MTDKTNLIREIHEYVTAHGGENTATHLLVQAASAIQTQAAELEAVSAGGVRALSAAPAEQQAAPKTAPGVGNSGFDHQTAADFLNGKTVSDEAVRKFVAASRWAHDERAALSATLLAMYGVLTSREAEIALLKKALLEAETAPQPSPAAQEDAACWHWLAEYLVGTRTDLDDEIVASETVNDLRKLVEAAIKQGADHDR